MRTLSGAVALLGILGLGNDSSVNFDAVKPGVAPPNWSFVSARGVPHGAWEVRYDPSAPSRGNVLEKVTGGSAGSESPVAIFDKVICRDGELSVKFKIEGRGRGRSAGVVWRYQDSDNYDLLHFNVDEKRIGLYRVRNGKSESVRVLPDRRSGPAILPGGPDIYHDVRLGQWYVAKVIFRGPNIRVFVGNRRLFDAEDSTAGTAGKAGVWTQGRTTASFDDFRIEKKS
jgi:hypothetical protein